MMCPLVSFVVPSYNAAPFVGDCLRSILAQTATADYEIILINDASPDDTDSVARSFSDPRLIYICHPRNYGHVVTINEGFARARGKYIARIDSDDRYRPNYLERVLPIFEQHPQVGLVYGDVAMIDPSSQVLAAQTLNRHAGRDFWGDEYIALLQENFIPAPTVIARREAWDTALPIPKGLGFSDWYLSLRIARAYFFYFVNDVIAEYRLHSTNLHREMLRDYSEEQTIFRLLAQAFAEPDHAAEKARAKAGIYATHFARLGDKYFGRAMYADARRCYLRAVQSKPRLLLDPGILRRLAATFGPDAYTRFKNALRPTR